MSPEANDSGADCGGLRFLVVEDHAFQRRILVQLLNALGAREVREAEDGLGALQALHAAREPVDVVVSDLWMPGMDGIEFVRQLGASGSRVSVILTSALDAEARDAVAREARASGLRLLGAIEKPVTAARLAPLLARHRSAAAAEGRS